MIEIFFTDPSEQQIALGLEEQQGNEVSYVSSSPILICVNMFYLRFLAADLELGNW